MEKECLIMEDFLLCLIIYRGWQMMNILIAPFHTLIKMGMTRDPREVSRGLGGKWSFWQHRSCRWQGEPNLCTAERDVLSPHLSCICRYDDNRIQLEKGFATLFKWKIQHVELWTQERWFSKHRQWVDSVTEGFFLITCYHLSLYKCKYLLLLLFIIFHWHLSWQTLLIGLVICLSAARMSRAPLPCMFQCKDSAVLTNSSIFVGCGNSRIFNSCMLLSCNTSFT